MTVTNLLAAAYKHKPYILQKLKHLDADTAEDIAEDIFYLLAVAAEHNPNIDALSDPEILKLILEQMTDIMVQLVSTPDHAALDYDTVFGGIVNDAFGVHKIDDAVGEIKNKKYQSFLLLRFRGYKKEEIMELMDLDETKYDNIRKRSRRKLAALIVIIISSAIIALKGQDIVNAVKRWFTSVVQEIEKYGSDRINQIPEDTLDVYRHSIPTLIPDGFTVEDDSIMTIQRRITYNGPDNRKIFFSCGAAGYAVINADNEHGERVDVKINDYDGQYYDTGNEIMLIWGDGVSAYKLTVTSDYKDMIYDIAESVQIDYEVEPPQLP